MLTGSEAALPARVTALELIVDTLLRARSHERVAEADDALPAEVARRIRGIRLVPHHGGMDHLSTLHIVDGQGIRRDYLLTREDLEIFPRAADETARPAAPNLEPDEVHALARARLTNAEAERVELEVAATRRALNLCDDSPLVGYSVSVDHEPRRPGERILRIGFDGGTGRTAVVALPFALALKLNGSIGRAVAERLDDAGGI